MCSARAPNTAREGEMEQQKAGPQRCGLCAPQKVANDWGAQAMLTYLSTSAETRGNEGLFFSGTRIFFQHEQD